MSAGKIVAIIISVMLVFIIGVVGIFCVAKLVFDKKDVLFPQEAILETTRENRENTDEDSFEEDESEKAPEKFTETEVKEYFEWLIEKYSGEISSQAIFLDEDSFSDIYLEWFMPSELTYVIQDTNSIEYEDSISCLKNKNQKLKISDIMSESEFSKLKNSDFTYYDVFSVEDIESEMNMLWRKGRFDVEDLDKNSFNKQYITSEGYLFCPIVVTDAYGGYEAKYLSCEEKNNEYIVSAYLIEVTDYYSGVVSDASTGCVLGSFSLSEIDTDKITFNTILMDAKVSTSELETVKFIFEGTNDGLKFKRVEVSKTLPDETFNYVSKTVRAEGGLNLRCSPSTNATIVYLIPNGSTFYVTGESDTESDWLYGFYYADGFNYSGWVHKNYLK